MIDFKQVEAQVKLLERERDTGAIDQAAFQASMIDLIDVAPDGYYWMLGHKSHKWYRHDGYRWVADSPDKFSPVTELVDWDSIEIVWFVFSLVLLGTIGVIVFSSAIV
jgi:hypothetical protein